MMRILVVWTLCVPARAELTEGDPFAEPPPTQPAETESVTPDTGPELQFPPEVNVGPGPGFDQDELDSPLGDPSTLGSHATDLSYLTAALVTLASAIFSRRAVRNSSQAMRDLWSRSQRTAELRPLVEAVEELRVAEPEVLERIARRNERYQQAWSALAKHLGPTPKQSPEQLEKSLHTQVKALLDLPLLKRRTRVKADLKKRVDAWTKSGNPEPLLSWITKNQDSDLFRTAKGRKWQEQLENLRFDQARARWKAGDLKPMLDWVGSTPAHVQDTLLPNGWAKTLAQLQQQERLSAEALVKEVSSFTRRISEAAGPKVFGPLLTLGDATRPPGSFQIQAETGVQWVRPADLLGQSNQVCQQWLSRLGSHATRQVSRTTLGGIGRRLLFPAAPVAGGLTIGGHYTLEGIRYYLAPAQSPEIPDVPPLLKKPN